MNAAGAIIVGMQPRARGSLIEHHQLLALFKPPQGRGQRANVHGLGGDIEEVRKDASDLVKQHPNDLGPVRDFNSRQFFDRQHKGVLLVHWRDIVEAIKIGRVLQIGARLHQFFSAAMQQADMGIDPFNNLTVQFQHQTQNAVRCRVLRAEIDAELAQSRLIFRRQDWRGRGVICHGSPQLFAALAGAGLAFSSPGSTGSAPSQGERKSKARYSWVNFTGS